MTESVVTIRYKWIITKTGPINPKKLLKFKTLNTKLNQAQYHTILEEYLLDCWQFSAKEYYYGIFPVLDVKKEVNASDKRKARVDSMKKQYVQENVEVVVPQVEIDKTEELINWTKALPNE